MKEYFKKIFGKDNKKRTENLVVFLIILVITFVAIKYIMGDKKVELNVNKNTSTLAQNSGNTTTDNTTEGTDLEQRLAEIINTINGIQKVKVLVTYSESSSYTPVFNEDTKENTTEETDSSGGVRKTTEKDSKKEIVYEEESNNKVPITSKTVAPKIEGVIITAIGVKDAVVKSNVIQAIEAATGVPTHKIQVFEMNK